MVLKYDDDDEYPCGREKMRGEERIGLVWMMNVPGV